MSFNFSSNNQNSTCVPMMTMGNNNKPNVIGYVCTNDNVEHFSQSANYNVEGFSNQQYATIEPFASFASGKENTSGTVDCASGNVVNSVSVDYYNDPEYKSGWGIFSNNVPVGRDTTNKVFQCGNQPSCTRLINNSTMGNDPSPNHNKSFTMMARCIPPQRQMQ
jgi:hypothetical protein